MVSTYDIFSKFSEGHAVYSDTNILWFRAGEYVVSVDTYVVPPDVRAPLRDPHVPGPFTFVRTAHTPELPAFVRSIAECADESYANILENGRGCTDYIITEHLRVYRTEPVITVDGYPKFFVEFSDGTREEIRSTDGRIPLKEISAVVRSGTCRRTLVPGTYGPLESARVIMRKITEEEVRDV